MGCYDTIIINCPKCGKEAIVQTKALGDNTLETFGVGDTFDSDNYNGAFQIKDNCEHCGEVLKIQIKNGKIIGTTCEAPKYIERAWGEVDEM